MSRFVIADQMFAKRNVSQYQYKRAARVIRQLRRFPEHMFEGFISWEPEEFYGQDAVGVHYMDSVVLFPASLDAYNVGWLAAFLAAPTH